MISRTTAWRRRNFGIPADGRGRHLESERGERLAFVGAVTAQLLAKGSATHSGLKAYGERVPTVREKELKRQFKVAGKVDNAEETKRLLPLIWKESHLATCGDSRPVWAEPPAPVMAAIQAAPYNADCLALVAAACLGEIIYKSRDKRLRGMAHDDATPRREKMKPLYWKAIEGMTRQTASYWKNSREHDYEAARKWLAVLLYRHGLTGLPEGRADLATLRRDDLADAMAGLALKVHPRVTPGFVPGDR